MITDGPFRIRVAVVCLLAALATAAAADIPGLTLRKWSTSPTVSPRLVAAGPDGTIWFSDERFTPHSVGFLTPDQKATVFPIPCPDCLSHTKLSYIESIVVGPDGNLWFAWTHVASDGSPLNGGMNSFVSKVTPQGQFTDYAMPTKDAFRRFVFGAAGHSAITVGPDGNLWFTENTPHKIGKITAAGQITEYTLPSNLRSPSIITKGPDGNLWFTATSSSAIGRITPDGVMTRFTVPNNGSAPAAPFGITAGTDGNLWFSDWASQIGRITPSGSVKTFALPPRSTPNHITALADGKVYFPYATAIGNAGDYEGFIGQFDPAATSAAGAVEATDHVPGLQHTQLNPKGYGFDIAPTVKGIVMTISEQRSGAPNEDLGAYGDLVLPCPNVTFVPQSVEPAMVGKFRRYVFFLVGPYSLSVTGSVPGMTLEHNEVLQNYSLFGTPTEPGEYTITVTATPPAGRPDCLPITRRYTLVVDPPCPPPSQFTVEPAPPDANYYGDGSLRREIGREFEYDFGADSGPVEVTHDIPDVPPAVEGHLSGVPTTEGDYRVTVRRPSARPECEDSQTFVFRAYCPPLEVSPEHVADGKAFLAYQQDLVIGGAPEFDLTQAPGLTVEPTGEFTFRLKGTPSSSGWYFVTIRRKEGHCPPQEKVLVFQVAEAGLPVPVEVSVQPLVQSGVESEVTFAADRATDFELKECVGPDAGCTATTVTDDNSYDFMRNVETPTRFFVGVTPLDGPSAGLFSDFVPISVVPIPSLDAPSSAVVPLGFDDVKETESFLNVMIELRLHMGKVALHAEPEGTFTATADNATFAVFPASGEIPSQGASLRVTASRFDLPPGTTRGTLRIVKTGGGRTIRQDVPISATRAPSVNRRPRRTGPGIVYVVPAVAHASGANASQFVSDVSLTNVSASGAQYTFTYTPSAADGTRTGRGFALFVRSGQTIALDDILRNFYGIGALGESGSGSLEIRVDTPGARAIVISRLYNASPNGTLGQFIPGVPLSSFTGRGVIQSLQQVADSAAYRTNVGFVEGKGEPATLSVRILDGDGTVKATVPVDLQPFEHKQINGFIGANGVKFDDGRIEVEVTSSTGSVTSYASVVDNATNDPLLVSPAVASSDALSRSVLPGVADLNAGTNFHTDMRVYNPHASATANVTMTYHPQGAGQQGVVKTLSVPAKSVRALDDVLPAFFGVSNSGGAVLVTSSSSRPVIVTGRTYSRAAKGTYGQFIPAVGAAQAASLGGAPLHLTLLEESPAFRTNVGLFEVSGAPARVRLTTTVPGTATPAVYEADLEANEFRQIGRFLSTLGIGDAVYNAKVTVEVMSGSGKVGAYASVVDNKTQDPTYIPAQR